MHRTIIPGPPGTGKTHRLMHYLDEELKKTDPKKIVYIAFDVTASSTTGIPVLAGATYESNFPVDFREKVSVVSASGTPTVSGVVWGVHS